VVGQNSYYFQSYSINFKKEHLKKQQKKKSSKMPWEEVYDENGNPYYYNSDTNETSWEPPAGFFLKFDVLF
jgi:hypothetical protein